MSKPKRAIRLISCLAVRHGVVGLALAIFQLAHAPWRAEVDTAGQLAHDEDIQARDHFRLEARRVSQLRVEDRRAQVAEQAQLRTDLQQATLRADITFDLVPFRAAHRAEQYGVGRAGAVQGFIGQWHAVLVDGRAADHVVAQLKAQAVLAVGEFQHLDRFGHDFRTNTVARENQNLLAHAFLISSSDPPMGRSGKINQRSAHTTSTSVLKVPSA